MLMTATNLESSIAVSMQRFVEGWTPRQVRQHREAFEAALRAMDSFMTSPRGQGMHPDALRYWNSQRSQFHQHVQQLDQILMLRPEATPQASNPLLAGIQRLIAGKSPSEVLSLRDEVVQHVRSLTQRDINLSSPSVVADPTRAADRHRLARHRCELEFLNHLLERR
jgi:hypothetical protein